MKLIFLTHDSYLNGGAQKCLFELLRGIKETHPSCQIYMIFPNKGDMIEQCLPYINGYKIIRSSWWITPNRERNRKLNGTTIKKLIKESIQTALYCCKIRPNYAITNTIVAPTLAIACKLVHIKHLWFIHEIPNTWNNYSFILRTPTILNIVNKLSHKILVTSHYAKEFYSQSIPEKKLQVINQAVKLEPVTNPTRENKKRYTLALIGSFDSNKGQMELLQAVNQIIASNKEIYCYLVGNDCGLMEECKEYVIQNKLTPFVSVIPFSNQVEQYYALSDVLVVCSTLETFGRVAVEAQKGGLPVILSNVGANPERIKSNINGLLYEKGDIDDLINKIEILRDNDTRAKFSQNIDLTELEKYSSTNFANEFMEAL